MLPSKFSETDIWQVLAMLKTSVAMSTYKFPESDKRWHYKIKFDVSLQLDELWVDSQTLDYLNSFRDEIFPSQGFPLSAVP